MILHNQTPRILQIVPRPTFLARYKMAGGSGAGNKTKRHDDITKMAVAIISNEIYSPVLYSIQYFIDMAFEYRTGT